MNLCIQIIKINITKSRNTYALRVAVLDWYLDPLDSCGNMLRLCNIAVQLCLRQRVHVKRQDVLHVEHLTIRLLNLNCAKKLLLIVQLDHVNHVQERFVLISEWIACHHSLDEE